MIKFKVRLFELEQLEKDYVPFLTDKFNAKHVFVICRNREHFNQFISKHIKMIHYEYSGFRNDCEYERYQIVLPLISYMDDLQKSDPTKSKYVTLNEDMEWGETTKEDLINILS